MSKEQTLSEIEHRMIEQRLAEIKKQGFGELTIYVRNKCIYRVKASYEDYMDKKMTS